MKKWFAVFTTLSVITACSSSNESKQYSNDKFAKTELPTFSPLNTAGITLPKQDPNYQLPATVAAKTGQNIDIRPPSTPIAIINNSVAQFDGERASIVYPADKKEVYSLQQISRLLGEQNIQSTTTENKLETDWTTTGRADDVGDVQVRYQIEQLGNAEASALTLSILQAKRDGVIFTPSVKEKELYTSDRLNSLVRALNTSYTQQKEALNNEQIPPMNSALSKDEYGRPNLVVDGLYNHVWTKLAQTLPILGFKIDSENPGRLSRVLAYKPLKEEQRTQRNVPDLLIKKGDYKLQLSVIDKRSAIVITDEENNPLSEEQAQVIYGSISQLLSK